MNRPVPKPEYEFFRRTYYRLSRSRLWGDSLPQAIQVADIRAECRACGMYELELQDLAIDLVQGMDQVYIQHVQEQQAAKRAESDVVSK